MPLTLEIQRKPFWSLSADEAASLLQTDVRKGLPEDEAKKRLKVFGANIIEKPQKAPAFFIFLNQLKSPLILILLVAGVVTLFIDHYRDSAFIFAAVVVNTALGFYQEYKAERALAELKNYLKDFTRIVRDGVEREIEVSELVPGDLIRLSQGDRAPADARLVFVNDLQVDEAVLTGESLPAVKSAEPATTAAGLGDQHSMIFAGTLVTQGTGSAIVCRTDFSTELGKIASLVAESHAEDTPLQAAVKRFSVWISVFLGALTLAVFGTGIAFGYSWVEMFITSVAIAVSAVPEGLPIAMTVILAIGVQRMARRKGIIRRLIAAEALGSTTLILTDKTGTLTMANMELEQVVPLSGATEAAILEMALLNTNVLVENPGDPPAQWKLNGRVIEVAIVRSLGLRGKRVEDLQGRMPVLNSLPFNAVNKFSVSLVAPAGGGRELVYLGAPDILIAHSALGAAAKEGLLREIDSLAGSGELVIGVATQKAPDKEDFSFAKDLKPEGLELMGLITLRDPVRPSVKDAIQKMEGAGIKIVILTGDHRGTAEAVAREVGLRVEKGSVLDAAALRAMSDAELAAALPSLKVIARVSPLDKLRIAKAFQQMGEIVAMTGDGVNDAPSIKQADIGVAMGSGTEVARDVADLVLLDDNFETIAAAVEEGRQIMNNLKKVLVYMLSKVMDGLLLIGGALLAGLALPLNALQILWTNFFSDSFPAVAFAFEKDDGLERRPRGGRGTLFDPMMKVLILGIGLLTSVLLFGMYWFLLRTDLPEELVRTFIFACFGTYNLFLAFPLRSLDKSIFQYSPFSNRYMLGAVAAGIVLMAVAIYVPFLQILFDTVALPPLWILAVLLVSVVNIAAVEFGKWAFRARLPKVRARAN